MLIIRALTQTDTHKTNKNTSVVQMSHYRKHAQNSSQINLVASTARQLCIYQW